MLQTFVLALVQSVAEFLPISSSAHLILVPKLLHWPDQGIEMDIALHVGTLGAVLVYFWQDFIKLLFGFYKKGPAQKLFINLCIATIPALIVGFFLKDIVETTFRSPLLIAGTLMVFGIALYVADRVGGSQKEIKTMTRQDAFVIGMAQCLALIPGVSRSGITMTAGRLCRIKRTAATQFSMMLSVPVIAAAAVWHIGKLFFEQNTTVFNVSLGWGILFAFVGGLIAVTFLMRWVKTKSFFAFMVYRLALGLYLLYVFL